MQRSPGAIQPDSAPERHAAAKLSRALRQSLHSATPLLDVTLVETAPVSGH